MDIDWERGIYGKPKIGIIAGLLVFAGLVIAPFDGLSSEGQLCLALTFMTVVFWAFQLAPPGFVSVIYKVIETLDATKGTKMP